MPLRQRGSALDVCALLVAVIVNANVDVIAPVIVIALVNGNANVGVIDAIVA